MKTTLWWVAPLFAVQLLASCKKDEGDPCFAKSDCAQGLVCSGEALSRCQKCADLEVCLVGGECTAKDGRCVATSDEECKQSSDCKEKGPCTAQNGVCVVGSDADCKQSDACAKDKYCVAKGDNCVVGDKTAAKDRAE